MVLRRHDDPPLVRPPDRSPAPAAVSVYTACRPATILHRRRRPCPALSAPRDIDAAPWSASYDRSARWDSQARAKLPRSGDRHTPARARRRQQPLTPERATYAPLTQSTTSHRRASAIAWRSTRRHTAWVLHERSTRAGRPRGDVGVGRKPRSGGSLTVAGATLPRGDDRKSRPTAGDPAAALRSTTWSRPRCCAAAAWRLPYTPPDAALGQPRQLHPPKGRRRSVVAWSSPPQRMRPPQRRTSHSDRSGLIAGILTDILPPRPHPMPHPSSQETPVQNISTLQSANATRRTSRASSSDPTAQPSSQEGEVTVRGLTAGEGPAGPSLRWTCRCRSGPARRSVRCGERHH